MTRTDKTIILVIMSLALFVGAAIGSYPIQQKTDFVTSMQALSQYVLTQRVNASSLVQTYYDRGYNSGGANELIAADLVGTSFEDMPIADITAMVTALEQMANYFDNAAVTQADYASSYIKVAQ